jgi:tetratricopeptide (TPR) repeat protein
MNPDDHLKGKYGLITAGICALTAVVVHLQVLGYDFVYDDVPVLVKGTYIKNWSNFFKIYTAGALKDWGQFVDPARPLNNLSYFIDYTVWGMNPAGFHATSLMLHAIAVGFSVWAAARLIPGIIAPTLVGLLMAVHPVHTETVACISYREDVLAAAFGFLTLGLWWSSSWCQVKAVRLVAILAAFAGSVLSKESALVVPLIGVGGDFILVRLRPDRNKRWKDFLSPRVRGLLYTFAVAEVLAYIVFRLLVSSGIKQEALYPLPKYAIPYVIGEYIKLLVWPARLNADWVVHDATSTQVLVGLLLIAMLVGIALLAVRRLPLVSFGMMAFLVSLGPVSNIMPLYRSVAERYLYLPSWGFFLALAAGAAWLCLHLQKRKPFFGLAIVATVVLFGLAVTRTLSASAVWKNQMSLWTATAKVSPNSYRAWNNLGLAQTAAKDYKAAIASYLKALEIRPDHVKAMNNLAALYMMTGEVVRAEETYQRLTNCVPSYAVAHQNLGWVYQKQGKLDQAIERYRQAIKLNKRYVKARANLARVLLRAGRPEEALAEAKATLEIDPTNWLAKAIKAKLEGKERKPGQ